jgi:hypothetical protein
VGEKWRFWLEIDEILAQITYFYIEGGGFLKNVLT